MKQEKRVCQPWLQAESCSNEGGQEDQGLQCSTTAVKGGYVQQQPSLCSCTHNAQQDVASQWVTAARGCQIDIGHRISDILLCLSPGQRVIPVVSAGQGRLVKKAHAGAISRQRTCTRQVLELSTHLQMSSVQLSVTETWHLVQPVITLYTPGKGWT